MRAGLSASAFTILALPAAATANEGSISPTANETAGLAEPDNDAGQDDDFHDRRLDYDGAIIVTAIGLSQLDVLAGTSVLEGAQLHRNLSGQIGDVLAKLPGVSSTGFSPGASRPVLRGLRASGFGCWWTVSGRLMPLTYQPITRCRSTR